MSSFCFSDRKEYCAMAIAFLLLWLASGIVGGALSGRRGFSGEARGNQERGCAVALERIRLTLRTERDAVMRNKLQEATLPLLKKNPLVVHFREAHLKKTMRCTHLIFILHQPSCFGPVWHNSASSVSFMCSFLGG